MHRKAVLSAFVALLACGCGSKPPAAPDPVVSPPASAVTISGLENLGRYVFWLESVPLRATAAFPDGSLFDCTSSAQWVSLNPNVARFGYPTETPGVVYAWGTGVTTIRATCGGVTGEQRIHIRFATLQGYVRNGPTKILTAFVEQQAPSPSPSFTNPADGHFVLDLRGLSPDNRDYTIAAVALGFETLTVQRTWNRDPDMQNDLFLEPARGTRLLQDSRALDRNKQARYEFRVPRSGALRLETYTLLEPLIVELRCNDSIVQTDVRTDRPSSSRIRVLETPARPDCAYELKFHQNQWNSSTFDFVLMLKP